MICPRCKQDMIVVEYQQIELDYCPNCEGVWFDADELELFLNCWQVENQDLSIGEVLNLPELKSPDKPLKCPRCNKKMRQVAIGDPAINIDACARAHGLWFDGGEVNQLLQQMKTGASAGQPVLDFMGEIFTDKG